MLAYVFMRHPNKPHTHTHSKSAKSERGIDKERERERGERQMGCSPNVRGNHVMSVMLFAAS